MRFSKSLGLGIVLLGASLAFSAQQGQQEHQHQHRAEPAEKVGNVHFPVSCGAAQQEFDRAVAMLHSFWYERAEQTFADVAKADSTCAMAYWGIAMSYYHQYWDPPNPAGPQPGLAAIAKAKEANPKTQREWDYIAAIEAFYKDADKLDTRTRKLAYEKAMEQVYLRYPDDREAGVFYALALISTAPPTDKTYANQKRAAAILDKVFAVEPDHPGVAHYFIHAYDSPALAHLALPAARRYAKLAPAVPHALHMPSHIFTRLGLWEESIVSNSASAAAARDFEVKMHMNAAWDQRLHPMDYLEYAYLQTGQDRAAKRVVDEVRTVQRAQPEVLAAAYALAAIPARYALERHRWEEAASLELHPSTFSWDRNRGAEAIVHYARAMGAARSGNLAKAREEAQKLESLRDALKADNDSYWAGQVEVARRAASAWTARAEGKNELAIELLRSAADLEDATEKSAVTPGAVIPAREQLAELLLGLQKPAEALLAYEACLRDAPNRFNALYGAAKAAELSGNPEKAKAYFAKLVEVAKHADGDRPELREAKTLLAKTTAENR